jgi:hypothetical protein
MKSVYISLLLACCIIPGCGKKLVEAPHSSLTPSFFSTAQGFQAGLDAAYAGNRNLWGTENFTTLFEPGTDAFSTGRDGNNNISFYTSGYDATSGYVSGVWNPCYTFINTCNGLVDNAANLTGISQATLTEMVAEAKFLRADYYFILVQQWGSVTLNEHFQSTATTAAARAPIDSVYNFIIQDLKDAVAGLPPSPVQNSVEPGKATAAAALHLLAKVYLTRAGSPAKQPDDYQNAYATAKQLLDNSASWGLGLLPDYGQVFAPGNEANQEVLWTVQHSSNLAYSSGTNSPENDLCYFFLSVYDIQPGMQRTIQYGRPFSRFMPTHWLTDTLFKENVNDQRYNKMFRTVWLSNNAASIPKVNGVPAYALGDTAIYMPGYDVSDAVIAATRYQLIPPRDYTRVIYPAMIKYDDPNRSSISAASVRPIIVYRLAETYLIAAEAAYMTGDNADAVKYINAVRERAAYPSGNAAAMDINASNLSIDFILDERARELFGENTRWTDLVRTGKLLERVQLHNPDGALNIKSYDVLRPIPQSQINAVITGPAYTQNTGF